MSGLQDNYAAFSESFEHANEYPMNWLRTEDFRHTLQEYSSKLDEDEINVFSDNRTNICIWDLDNAEDDQYRETMIRSTDQLQPIFTHQVDPLRRFIFLRSASSRDPLSCSRIQAMRIFTYHQVMPSFLGFIFTFKRREDPHFFTSFRYENYLSPFDKQSGLSSLGRSGIRIQHCFNLLGMEEDKGKWLQRQVAAYHSFDLTEGRAFWIMIKGNATMRKRVQDETLSSPNQISGSLKRLGNAFGQTLVDHMILLQWCVENWASYLSHFEERYQRLSLVAQYGPVHAMIEDIPYHKTTERTPLGINSRRTTGFSQISSPRELLHTLSFNSTRKGTDLSEAITISAPIRKEKNLKLEEVVNFKGLQELNRLDGELDAATSIIDQNKVVLAELKTHYQELVDSYLFKLQLGQNDDLELCKQHTANFVQKIGGLEGDLSNYRRRLETLLRGVEKTGTTFTAILNYQNMRTAEYFSKSAQDSSDLMQEWTRQMHAKTMSMHVITVFTLIFLPGTFVASIFSSGILSFGNEGEGGFGPQLGDWKVRLAGLKLYFIISFPLMALTLIVWSLAYGLARFRANGEEQTDPEQGIDLLENHSRGSPAALNSIKEKPAQIGPS